MKYEPANELRDLLRQRQGWAAQLLAHLDDLDRADRALLRSVYQHGMSVTDLADVLDRQPRTIRQRVLRLARRITSPEFQYVVRNRRHWSAARRAIVERAILRGRTQRAIAAELGISLHRVRKECDCIRHALEAAREERAASPAVERRGRTGTHGITRAEPRP